MSRKNSNAGKTKKGGKGGTLQQSVKPNYYLDKKEKNWENEHAKEKHRYNKAINSLKINQKNNIES